jgi:hypothetical protein
MKKVISTIVAIGCISSMLVNTAHAGSRNGGGINPIWIPVAILSTLAAITIAQEEPVVHERRVIYEPRHAARYEEPRHYRHTRYDSHDERVRYYEPGRHREYR